MTTMTRTIIVFLLFIASFSFGQSADTLKYTIDQKKQMLLNILKSDTIEFQLNTSGCFSGSTTKISVTRVKHHYLVKAKGGIYGRESERRISKRQLNQVKRIFYKGFQIKSKWRCTSSERIIATSNKQSVDFLDQTCKFNYGDKFQKKLHIYKDLNFLD